MADYARGGTKLHGMPLTCGPNHASDHTHSVYSGVARRGRGIGGMPPHPEIQGAKKFCLGPTRQIFC